MNPANQFIDIENARRTAAYRSGREARDLMERMNAALESIEVYEPSGIARPNLFIFGLPRSGTTLLYQVAARCFDVGYINNVSARFWRAPLTGVTFSQVLLGGRRDESYQSDYGKSIDLSGPHEFSYFWQNWLRITDIEAACRFGVPNADIDWAGLVKVIGSLQDKFGSGMVHKTNFVANLISDFAKHLQMPLFIYIDRDCADVALSILGARKKYYDDLQTWWATYPPSYEEIKDIPFGMQIARQVHDLRAVYERCIASVRQDLVLKFSYSSLCENPASVLRAIQQRALDCYGADIRILDGTPKRFNTQQRAADGTPGENEVLQALKALGL
jgi:hypothetical protein